MDPRSLHKISYGLYVISSRRGSEANGQIANALFQVTSEPKTIAVSINKDNLTHSFIEDSGVFVVTTLPESTPMDFIRRFGFNSGRDVNKLEGIEFRLGKTHAPVVLENALAFMEARVIDSVDVGTHTIFVGRVEEAEVLSDESPLTYEHYRRVKGGRAPKNAPTFIAERESDVENEATIGGGYQCRMCGYIYDPGKGDPEKGILPGTPFEEIPDDWKCPGCGASKRAFKKL